MLKRLDRTANSEDLLFDGLDSMVKLAPNLADEDWNIPAMGYGKLSHPGAVLLLQGVDVSVIDASLVNILR